MSVVVIYTLAQYTALSDAIAQGVQKVKYSDKEIEYRSLEEMLRIQATMYGQLFGTRGNNSRRFVNFSKGTNPRYRGGGCR